jgi:hypothetical protein
MADAVVNAGAIAPVQVIIGATLCTGRRRRD